jgi:hypothetical protein
MLLAIVFAAKLPTMSTPYYWDETLWIGFAHRLAGLPLSSVLPGQHEPATAFANRAPGLFVLMALLFKLSGPSIWLSHFVIACFAYVGVYYTFRLGALLYGSAAGVMAALFLFFNGMYFAQAGMFLADVPVTACGVACVFHAVRRRYLPYLAWALAVVLLKETGLAIVFAVSLYILVVEWPRGARPAVGAMVAWALPLLAMGGYYTVQALVTGIAFANYGEHFVIYRPDAGVVELERVTRWLFVEQQRWIFTALIAASLVGSRAMRQRPELLLFALIVFCAGYTLCFLYFLPRYLLPVAPYVYVVAAGGLAQLVAQPVLRGAVAAGLLGLMITRLSGAERPGNREWDMGYQAVVRAYAAAAAYVEREHPAARVVTTWPLSVAMADPRFGYVSAPLRTARLRDVSPLDAADDFDAVVATQQGDADPRALVDYAALRGLPLAATVGAGRARCAIYLRRAADP